LSRIESGKAVYKFEPCSVNTVAEVSIKEFVETAEKKKIILTNNMDKGLPLVSADFEKIHWVMNNLINNALKYTGSGNCIVISSKVDRDYIYITVRDTGTGIPTEYIDRIFDKFVQVEGRDIEVRGTGLGLSVAREIVNAHKGEIWVESELDAGSSFTFKLPVLKMEMI
jgi:signal transduction histidine kinase